VLQPLRGPVFDDARPVEGFESAWSTRLITRMASKRLAGSAIEMHRGECCAVWCSEAPADRGGSVAPMRARPLR